MTGDNVWVVVAVGGFGGFGLGLGLVLGAFTARALRRYMTREDLKPYDRPERRQVVDKRNYRGDEDDDT